MEQRIYDLIKRVLEEKRWIIDIENGIIKTRKGIANNIGVRGYKIVGTTIDGKKYGFKQHQVIAIAGGLNPVGFIVNHLDGDKTNNRFDNLELTDISGNTKHSFDVLGRKVHNRLFNEEQLEYIVDQRKKGVSGVELARQLNCHPETIYRIGKKYYKDLS